MESKKLRPVETEGRMVVLRGWEWGELGGGRSKGTNAVKNKTKQRHNLVKDDGSAGGCACVWHRVYRGTLCTFCFLLL